LETNIRRLLESLPLPLPLPDPDPLPFFVAEEKEEELEETTGDVTLRPILGLFSPLPALPEPDPLPLKLDKLSSELERSPKGAITLARTGELIPFFSLISSNNDDGIGLEGSTTASSFSSSFLEEAAEAEEAEEPQDQNTPSPSPSLPREARRLNGGLAPKCGLTLIVAGNPPSTLIATGIARGSVGV
jgi:hypothetical protein